MSQYPSPQQPWPPTGAAGPQGVGPALGPNAAHQSPTGPFGTPPPPVDIRQYAAPKARTSLIVAGVVAVGLVGALLAGALTRGSAPQPTPSPTASETSSAAPGMPFTMPGDTSSSGRWEVVDRQWTSDGVSVHVRVYASTGSVTYAFLAYGKGASTATQPTRGSQRPELTSGRLSTGEVADGYVFLPLEHAESTLFLTTRDGRAISALPIRA